MLWGNGFMFTVSRPKIINTIFDFDKLMAELFTHNLAFTWRRSVWFETFSEQNDEVLYLFMSKRNKAADN